MQKLLPLLCLCVSCAAPQPQVIDDSPDLSPRILEFERRLVEVESRLALTSASGWEVCRDPELDDYLRCVDQGKTIVCVHNGARIKKANAKKTLSLMIDGSKDKLVQLLLAYEYLNNYQLAHAQREKLARITELNGTGRCFVRAAVKITDNAVAPLGAAALKKVERKVAQMDERQVDKLAGFPAEFFSVRRKLLTIFQEAVSISDPAEAQEYETTASEIVCLDDELQHRLMKYEIVTIATGEETYLFEYK
jgi:hypothetical protein